MKVAKSHEKEKEKAKRSGLTKFARLSVKNIRNFAFLFYDQKIHVPSRSVPK